MTGVNMTRRHLRLVLQDISPRPDDQRVSRYIERRWLRVEEQPDGPSLDALDEARLRLICELERDFELPDDALELTLSLLDQLYGARAEIRNMVRAIERQPRKVQADIFSCLVKETRAKDGL